MRLDRQGVKSQIAVSIWAGIKARKRALRSKSEAERGAALDAIVAGVIDQLDSASTRVERDGRRLGRNVLDAELAAPLRAGIEALRLALLSPRWTEAEPARDQVIASVLDMLDSSSTCVIRPMALGAGCPLPSTG